MLKSTEKEQLERLKANIRILPPADRGRLMGMAFDAERRLEALHNHVDRTTIELARIRTHATDRPTRKRSMSTLPA